MRVYKRTETHAYRVVKGDGKPRHRRWSVTPSLAQALDRLARFERDAPDEGPHRLQVQTTVTTVSRWADYEGGEG